MAIYEQIGGAPSVNAAVERFYEKVISDPQLAGFFDNTDLARLKGHQRAFIAAALGGPAAYQGREMAAVHASLGVSDTDFDAVVAHLVATLDELEVPAETITQIGEALAPLREEVVTKTAVP